ncbi:c-type cytochrome [Caulobacter radicis]|uniref:Cytochrome C n=1 Tax=Caulobacter radicis TaxID=2172650 RepID=A0A2T9JI24_9CAUL|nr:c-type cytochrome [Caulobacter radicis]PVM83354.1 cytochrome C [Caulobacter radicis]PVM87685.1 cytochrome C [Caulobacter radicis]
MIGLAGATLVACADKPFPSRQLAGANPTEGLRLIEAEGCGACHHIPGVQWPRGAVGGSLDNLQAQAMIAGRFPNRPNVMIAWLRDAPAMAPDTAMPASRLTQDQARDVAAYLYSLDAD